MGTYQGFELWDTNSANIIAADANEERLLAVVRAYHDRYGRDLVAQWILIWVEDEDDDEDTTVAEGDDLITRAFAREAAAT